MKYCIVIPHYKHEKLFAAFLPKLLNLELPCIIVDDGSGEESLAELAALLEDYPDCHLVKHQHNRGKGAAVKTGCFYASAMGFTHALQLDADGQHDVNDVNKLVKCSEANPHSIICGQPFFDESAPLIRRYGRKITDFWVAFETFSFAIKDGLCGFRIYPLKEFEDIIDRYYVGPRMDFDPELLVKAVWANVDMKFLPTKVVYHENAVSHFNYIRDNGMMIKLHVRLIAGMLLRLPFLVHNRVKSVLS
ncbi:glycosyltransferase family 2 protein [Alteromonas sediminis]|uniref:Glycosyltransferase family 2 protein n=1 Tax=Alteromonas sediminis TaxID=2259342 RepID=A0A3N5XZC4_9ALTE|nr:glycosyltransferase family 2 protein [Alteromonas sediminis]RPJ65416.1 glycosyltransferase family 2 protein [Alteromonas sediminis]